MLTQTLLELQRQIRPADAVIVCPASLEDVDLDAVAALPFAVRIVRGGRGLCVQRNLILDDARAAGMDVIVFFDDDFFPCRDFLAQLEIAFRDHPQAVMVTGRVLADGATGPGYAPGEARAMIAEAEQTPAPTRTAPAHNGYGCNMAARMDAIVRYGVGFDPDLPIYGWLEDVDFSRRLAAASGGQVLKVDACRGVHLATKAGRTIGVRFGYSQIANPLHIAAKKAITPAWTLTQILRNVLANLLHVLKPEPWVDRRGRLLGNMLAARDLVTGRLHPRRILDLH
jgi:hypothetical protein